MGVSFPARRGVLLAGAFALLLALPAVGAAEDKIAVVDFQMIFDRYEATEDAQRTYDRELKEWDETAKEMRAKIDELTDEIESQRLMLSEDRLREKQDELRSLRDEYQSFAQGIWGVNGKASKRNAELTGPISEKIRDVVGRLAEEKDYNLVLDAGTGGVIWAKDDVNLTQSVLDDLALTLEGTGDDGSEID
ncbi:MAG: OmpH family outer membrane protein [Gemmatimonadetes bacterium]|nr:OmpH family outer membrane protein [Gemmatimonadota bacterium]